MSSYPEFTELLRIMEELRKPVGGCPWDREQTHISLVKYLREESFEVIEAIFSGDDALLCEELGDLILQVVFHAIIARERNAFDIKDVLNRINQKLINRHPHVFDLSHEQKDTLEDQWEKIKIQEKPHKKNKSCFDEIPPEMPPLLEAERIQLLAAKQKFDWNEAGEILEKIKEECEELRPLLSEESREKQKEEVADILFSVINLCRFLKFDPEELIKNSNKKFKDRFDSMVDLAKKEHPETKFKHMPIEVKEECWQKVKKLSSKE